MNTETIRSSQCRVVLGCRGGQESWQDEREHMARLRQAPAKRVPPTVSQGLLLPAKLLRFRSRRQGAPDFFRPVFYDPNLLDFGVVEGRFEYQESLAVF